MMPRHIHQNNYLYLIEVLDVQVGCMELKYHPQLHLCHEKLFIRHVLIHFFDRCRRFFGREETLFFITVKLLLC